jgi:OCT family organic cation transporter-like MFS transporter 4/5
VALTYLLEIVGGKWLTIFGLGIEFFWVASWLLLGAAAYFLRDWRDLMLATSAPGLAFVGLVWVMPESPRWLAVTGRTREAEVVLRRVAAINGRPLPDGWTLPADLHPDFRHHSRKKGRTPTKVSFRFARSKAS